MQFCLLHIDQQEARLSSFKIDQSSSNKLNLEWTDSENCNPAQIENEEDLPSNPNDNHLLDLLQRNLEKIIDPLIVQIGSSYGELYNLTFPFSDLKKIKQVINPELEDLLPFEPDFQNTNIAISLNPNSGPLTEAKVILIDRSLLASSIRDIELLGCIAPIFLYQPLVTEKLLLDKPHQPFICIELNGHYSYIYTYLGADKGITERALVLTEDINTTQELVLAQIGQNEDVHTKNLILINKTFTDIEPLFSSSSWERTIIDPGEYLNNTPGTFTKSSTLASSILCALALTKELKHVTELDDGALKDISLFNLREGEFKYRAPFSEFKENLFAEIVPFSLTAFFLIFFIALGFITPLREISLLEDESRILLKNSAPDLSNTGGKPLDIISNEIINLEGQIGGLTTMRSLSPFEWLYKLSIGLKSEVSLSLETLSITSSGITFRGTVPDYPSSGRLDGMLKAMLKDNQGLLCKAEANSEQGSSEQKVSITGVLELCQ